MVESAISIVVVGVMLVAALNMTSATAMGRAKMNDRALGQLLAMHLASEILQREYSEPDETPVFGPESSEADGLRSSFDDVDDYNDYVEKPPTQMDGTEVPDLEHWSRSVKVEYVSPSNLNNEIFSDLGVKKITVTVTHEEAEVAVLIAIRADGSAQALGRPLDPIRIE